MKTMSLEAEKEAKELYWFLCKQILEKYPNDTEVSQDRAAEQYMIIMHAVFNVTKWMSESMTANGCEVHIEDQVYGNAKAGMN